MKITRFDPKGIHLAEVTGIKDLEEKLPKDWFGFSNFVMRMPMSRDVREIDLAIVTHDRIILVDLKDWKGYIENRDNYWFQNEEWRERSAVLKN